METNFVTQEGKRVIIKTGLKGLIQLAKLLDMNVDLKDEDIIYWGLWPQAIPNLTQQEQAELAKQILAAITIPTLEQADEWYRQGLGEIGLSLDTLERLTPEELDLAYEGYLRRIELTVNAVQLAMRQPRFKKVTLVPEKEVTRGSQKEREETFEKLGIGGI